jgi:tRNA(fMet)-specific endonuclease VapC
MLVLDTDHVVEYQRGASAESHRLQQRLESAAEPYATTIVTVEEMMRGWMAAVRRIHDPHRQISAYANLRRLFRFFATWQVLDWNDAAADKYDALKSNRIRVGTMDLKIASIALANDATLLTRNTNDFARVPGLRIADWLQ